jgi:hypothetical protein
MTRAARRRGSRFWSSAGILLAIALVLGCSGEDQYSAEVGYYEGTMERWYIGQPKSRSQCTSEAIGMYNRLNYEKPGRAFSWACLLTRDGRYISRHR